MVTSVRSDIKFWPFNPTGALHPLFDADLLHHAFYVIGKDEWQVPDAVIRRGLKNLVKRAGRTLPKLASPDIRETDRHLVWWTCSDSRCRDLLQSMELEIVDVVRGRKRTGYFRVKRSLPELLWRLLYLRDDKFKAVAEWVNEASTSRADLGQRYFLTAASLKNSPPPADLEVDPADLSRIVLLFAALLPHDEAIELVDTAVALGCTALDAPGENAGDQISTVTRPPDISSVAIENASAKAENAEAITIDAPRLDLQLFPSQSEFLFSSSGTVRGQIEAVDDAWQKRADTLAACREDLGTTLLALVSASEPEFQKHLDALRKARLADEEWAMTRASARADISRRLKAVGERLGVQAIWISKTSSLEEVKNTLVRTDEVTQLAAFYDPAVRELREMGASLARQTDLDGLLQAMRALAQRAQRIKLVAKAEIAFLEKAKAFVSQKAPNPPIAEWLTRLGSVELQALFRGITPDWAMPRAYFARCVVDDPDPALPVLVDSALRDAANTEERRALIYFLDSASSALDQYPAARRVVILEHFRDIIELQPLASLSDPSSGLLDAALVGGSVVELVRVIAGHSELAKTGVELRAFIAVQPDHPDRVEELATFCTTPSMMTGIYFRLREAARAKYFAGLLRHGKLDVTGVRTLRPQLNIDDAVDEIVADVQSPTDRIEGRHKAQLYRYLSEGRDLLDAYLATVPMDLNPREKEFRVALRSICADLSTDQLAEYGSIQWLELGINDILHSAPRRAEWATLQGGGSGKLIDRAWRQEDTFWAQTALNLPLFYTSQSIDNTLSVISEALRWWGMGRKPSLADAAQVLADEGEFGAALALLEGGNEFENVHTSIQEQCELEFVPVKAKLDELTKKFGPRLQESSFLSELKLALSTLDVGRANESIEYLEIELNELDEVSKANVPDPAIEERRSQLRHFLLLADVSDIDANTPLSVVEARWQEEFERRANERRHIDVLSEAFRPARNYVQELSTDLDQIEQERPRADRWLPTRVSDDYAAYISPAAKKQGMWLSTVEAFSPSARQALVNLVRWFLRFLGEELDNLRALSNGESTDETFERVIELCHIIEQSVSPQAAVSALAAQGEPLEYSVSPDVQIQPPARLDANTEDWPTLRQALEAADWPEVIRLCNTLDLQGADPGQIEEIRTFADTANRLKAGSEVDQSELVAAARLLGLAGHPVQHALSAQHGLMIAADLIRVASAGSRRASNDLPWAGISRPQDFFRELASSNHPATRVVEQLVSGGLGAEVVDKLWEAVTKTTDPGVSRRALLHFLYLNRLHSQIVRLAAKHDAGIKTRLERLLEVRAVAVDRPDLIGVAQALTDQLAEASRPIFRDFLRGLPAEARSAHPNIRLDFDDEVVLRHLTGEELHTFVQIAVEPSGVVPSHVEATLFPEDDVSFSGGLRRLILTEKPVYSTEEWPLEVFFGTSWEETRARRDGFRVRVSAKAITGELIVNDADFRVSRLGATTSTRRVIDVETLLEAYPGVTNTPALGAAFHGRGEELERLRTVLVAAHQPSPVLLTGMRRVGKTSLLLAFHAQHRQVGRDDVLTIYLSLAERRAQLMSPEQDVSAVFFSAIKYALTKRHFAPTDHNLLLGRRIQERIPDKALASKAIEECRDPESLCDSLLALGDKLLEVAGGQTSRVVLLVDEAETLVLPYHAGGSKRRELEQFLQSLRELSQTSPRVSILLSGSNHISAFAQEYKNAFFGSCQQIDLEGIENYEIAARIVSPNLTKPYLDFHSSAVEFAINSTAGMPQFMWQIGAATAAIVRSGPVTRSDIRRGISKIIDDSRDLPFKAYDILEPIEHMLGLFNPREQDMLWLLLWRVANVTSLVATQAQQHLIIDTGLLELDDLQSWVQRLLTLVGLKILELRGAATYAFHVPIFGEGFRAKRHHQIFLLRQQRVTA